jgi:hypothetical protein
MDTEKMIELIRTLAYYHNNYRYDTHRDCISFECIDNIPYDELYECLTSYFIDVTDETISQAWRALDLVGKDVLIRSMNTFNKIHDIIIDGNLICFKYPFAFSNHDLYAMHSFLIDGNITAFKNTFPDVTEKSLEDEIDNLNLLMLHLSSIVNITIHYITIH